MNKGKHKFKWFRLILRAAFIGLGIFIIGFFIFGFISWELFKPVRKSTGELFDDFSNESAFKRNAASIEIASRIRADRHLRAKLYKLLQTDDPLVRATAARTVYLAWYYPVNTDEIDPILRDIALNGQGDERLWAAVAYSGGTANFLSEIVEALGSDDFQLACAAARALPSAIECNSTPGRGSSAGFEFPEEYIPAVIDVYLNSPSQLARRIAFQVLFSVNIRDRELARRFESAIAESPHPDGRNDYQPLINLLDSITPDQSWLMPIVWSVYRHGDEGVRRSAVKAFIELSKENDGPLLFLINEYFNYKGDVRTEVTHAIIEAGERSLWPIVEKYKQNINSVGLELIPILSYTYLEPILALLDETDLRLHHAAEEALRAYAGKFLESDDEYLAAYDNPSDVKERIDTILLGDPDPVFLSRLTPDEETEFIKRYYGGKVALERRKLQRMMTGLLWEELKKPSPDYKNYIAHLLVDRGENPIRVIDVWTTYASIDDSSIMIYIPGIINSLGREHREDLKNIYIRFLDHENVRLRRMAICSLLSMGDEYDITLPAIEQCVKESYFPGDFFFAADSAKFCRNIEKLGPVIKTLFTQDEFQARSILDMILRCGPEALYSVPVFLEASREGIQVPHHGKDDLFDYFFNGTFIFRVEEYYEILGELKEHPDPEVRQWAEQAIKKLNEMSIVVNGQEIHSSP